jgi:hypothetical protein
MHNSSVFCLGLVGKDDDDDKTMKMKRSWKKERTTMKTGKASSSMDNIQVFSFILVKAESPRSDTVSMKRSTNRLDLLYFVQ